MMFYLCYIVPHHVHMMQHTTAMLDGVFVFVCVSFLQFKLFSWHLVRFVEKKKNSLYLVFLKGEIDRESRASFFVRIMNIATVAALPSLS